MRLVVFSRDFSEYCFRYASAMAKHCEVLLVLDRRNSEPLFDVSQREIQPGLTISLLDFQKPSAVILSSIKIIRTILTFKPDYIHFQEIPDRVAPLFAFFFKIFSKIVWTIHDPSDHSGRDANLPADKRILRNIARRMANIIVTHGPTCGRQIKAKAQLADRVIVSEHGVLMVPEREVPPHLSGNILFFGRMEEYKGLDILVDAAEMLDWRGVKYNMIIAGRGPELEKNMSRLQNMSNIQVIQGFVSASAARDLFQNADVVVLPYKNATQSGVVAAAFGNNRPVIASRVGGLPDVVEHGVNGLLVEPNNAVALADALQTVVESPVLLERMNRGVRATAEGKLNWDNIAFALLRHFEGRPVLPALVA